MTTHLSDTQHPNRKVEPNMKAEQKSAVQREAEGIATVDIEYNGYTFTIASSAEDWSAGTLREFEKGHAVEAVRLLTGPAKWDKLGMDDWSGRQIGELFERFAEAAGFGSSGN